MTEQRPTHPRLVEPRNNNAAEHTEGGTEDGNARLAPRDAICLVRNPPTWLTRKVLFLSSSALIGAIMGGLFFPTWHHAVESAQVVAGLVPYSDNNPFYIYHRNSWSLLHQLLAVPLTLGMTERSLAFVLSGLIGALSYWTISYCAWNLHLRNIAIILIPLVVHLGRLSDHGPLYPVWILGAPSSYGIIGLTISLASMNLLVDKKRRISGLLLGVSLSIHPLLAAFTAVTLAIAAIASIRIRSLIVSHGFMQGFAVGALIALVSFLVFCSMRVDVPTDDLWNQEYVLRMFTENWGSHHKHLPLLSIGVGLALSAFLIPILLPFFRRNHLTVLLSVVSAVGLLLGAVSWLPQSITPLWVDSTLPVRYVTFGILFFPIFALTVLFRLNHVFAIGYSLLACVYWATHLGGPPEWSLLFFLFLFVAISFFFRIKCRPQFRTASTVVAVLLFFCPLVVSRFFRDCAGANYRFPVACFHTDMKDRLNDRFWEHVSKDSGVLLYTDTDCIQLLTRRPVLMSMALNQISYVPQTGPLINEILKDVFNLDITAPPDSPYIKEGALDARLYLSVWSNRSEEEWVRIRKKYNVTNILTWRTKLHLPQEAETERFRYYRIPPETRPKKTGEREPPTLHLQGDSDDPRYSPQCLIDLDRFWEVGNKHPQYLVASLNHPLTLCGITLSSGRDAVERMPMRITIHGFHDGATWQPIGSFATQAWRPSETKHITVPNKEAFSQYKLSFDIECPEKILRIYTLELSFLEADIDLITSSSLVK